MKLTVGSVGGGNGVFSTLSRIPGGHVLFAGPLSCLRHGMSVTLRNLGSRISFLRLTETDVAIGRYLEQIVEAAAEICVQRRPSCLVLVTCCQSALLGIDYPALTAQIQARVHIPVQALEVNRLYMYAKHKQPVTSVSPEQLLYDFLRPREKDRALSVNLLGGVNLDRTGELFCFLRSAGVVHIRTTEDCADFAAYQEMAGAHLNLVLTKPGEAVGIHLMQTLGIPWLPLNGAYDPQLLKEQYLELGKFLHYPANSCIKMMEERLAHQFRALRETPPADISIHGQEVNRALSLTKWLLENGLPVSDVQLAGLSGTEEELWLNTHYPEVIIHRVARRPVNPCTTVGDARPARELSPIPTGFQALERVLQLLAGQAEEVVVR